MTSIDHTHDASARSWLASADSPGIDFPIQNLPHAVFRRRGSSEAFRGGVAIGDAVVDCSALAASPLVASLGFDGLAGRALGAAAGSSLNDLFALGEPAWFALRHALFAALHRDAPAATVAALRPCLVAQGDVEYTVPARIGDFTDFYTSYHHADVIGRLFNPDAGEVVTPNFHWFPQAYHGRVSSIGTSGQTVRRPLGQSKAPDAATPVFGPSRRLDYEMELGFFVGTGNGLGERIAVGEAESHLFGVVLLDDWSVRDVQAWEMHPLGPFLAKNLATTISPWIVTFHALAPYREAWRREARFPQPLPYLDASSVREAGAIDIRLETWLESARRRAAGAGPVRIAATSFRHQHWTAAQMVAHHTVGGCNLMPGDLLGSGTISGPGRDEAAAMMELSRAGREPLRFADGQGGEEERAFLEDGDAVIFRGWCERDGFARIGFGECRGEVVAATPFEPA